MRLKTQVCPSCSLVLEADARLRRCPGCGADLRVGSLPDLPLGSVSSDNLQGPAFPQEHRPNDDTAPLSEFIAAGAVLGGVGLLVAAVFLQSGVVAIIGVALMFGVTGFFAITKGSMGRAILHYRSTMWTGRHLDEMHWDESADRDRRRRR